jgi:hypothetical protein
MVAAYCAGLALAAVAIISRAAGPHIVAVASDGGEPFADAAEVYLRWWCRRAADAERLAAAAGRTLRRESNNSPGAQADESSALSRASAAILAAARRLAITLQSDDDIAAAAMDVAARIEVEMQRQQQSGGLKSVNKAYRSYRLETSGRGERVLRYDEWMRQYKENLVRQVAATLRQI